MNATSRLSRLPHPEDLEEPSGGWVFDILDRLSAHSHRAAALRDSYDEVLLAADPASRYLIQLILDDERRHSQLTVGLALAVTGDESALPDLALMRDSVLSQTVHQLREGEEHDRESLRALHAELCSLTDTSLWQLVVELLIDDADRRIRILRFVEHHAST